MPENIRRATRSGTYSGLDAQRVARVAVDLDGGFAAFPNTDPVVVGDITGKDGLSGLDAQRIAQQVVKLDPVEIPSLPEPPQAQGLSEFRPAQTVQAGGSEIDVAEYSVPVLADWNSDGLPDLIVGENASWTQGKVRVYLNVPGQGTAENPIFDEYFYTSSQAADLVAPPADASARCPSCSIGIATEGRICSSVWPTVKSRCI